MNKRLLLWLLPLIFSNPVLIAQTTDFNGIKIFINPGHGGYDSNDRHILATDFWESEGNLVKGLYLRDLLENLNATVYMSRTSNSSDGDLPLSVIDEMANAANVDFFLSIHSNGWDGTQNLPLMLFRGYDDQPVFTDAKIMAEILWQKLYEKGNCWTGSNQYVKGDWTFYPQWGDKVGLGVLRTLTCREFFQKVHFMIIYLSHGVYAIQTSFIMSHGHFFVHSYRFTKKHLWNMG